MSTTGHGWIHRRPDGAQARCGGPEHCAICRVERGDFATKPVGCIVCGSDRMNWSCKHCISEYNKFRYAQRAIVAKDQ